MISNFIDLRIEKEEKNLEIEIVQIKFKDNINLYQKLYEKYKILKKQVKIKYFKIQYAFYEDSL